MEFINDRIGFVKTKDDLTVYIKASSPKESKKLNMLKLWVVLWSLAGVLIASQFFFEYTREMKLYLFIFMCFWGYFEYVSIRAYYFRRYGTETIYINNNKFMIRRDVYTKKGKPKWFQANEKSPFTFIESSNINSANLFYNSYWVVTGGNISFGIKKNEYRFGLQLEENAGKRLVKLLNESIKIQKQKTALD